MKESILDQNVFNDLQEIARLGFWEWDLSSESLYWSDGIYNLFGIEPQSFKPQLRYFLSRIADEDKERVLKVISEFFQEEKKSSLTHKVLRHDGQLRLIRISAKSVFESGKAVKISGTMQDITDLTSFHNLPPLGKEIIREETEEKRKADLIQKNLEAMAHIGSWQYCVRTEKLHWSDELYKIFGFEPGEIEPSLDYYLKATHPDERDQVKTIIDKAFFEPGQYSFIRRIMTAKGKISHIHTRISVICDQANEPVSIIGTSQDITFLVEAREDLMRSEEELEDSRKFINRIAEASPFIIYVYDIPEKKIVYMNRELLQMLGYKKGESNELEPGFFKSLLHPDDLIKLPDWMTRYSLLKDGETLETEFRMKHKNDSWRFICTRETVFKRGMTYAPIQILGIGQDITERKQNEEERTNLKLQQQKDILNAMLKTQEDERKRIAESLHNGLGQLLYGAKIKIETLANLLNKTKQDTSFLWVEVNDLIDEAINTTRTISFELTPAILEDFGVEVALKELCKKLTSEKLRLTCEVYDLTARLDNSLETAIFRISQELINNIIKHSEATEGLIKIENKKGYIAVVARDNGKGFDTLVHNEGQGLRNIKNRVKLLNGQIKIESELNKGTTITINLFQL